MITIRFAAGLGNQMLQFATYTAMKKRYPGTKVRADVRAYNFSRIHNGMELERIFPVRLDLQHGNRNTKVSPVGRYWHFAMYNLVSGFYKAGFPGHRFIRDSGVFNPELLSLDVKNNYYIEGQWGNQKYFENAITEIREAFRFVHPLDEVNAARAKAIGSGNSVSVHIRRGDYLNNPDFVELSRSDYYPNAFHYISGKVDAPVFYIFSDEPDWCRENLTWLSEYRHEFITGNKGNESYKDMQLMSMCRHNIIANSTFSWWGGWLNSNPEKILICPSRLFYTEERNAQIVKEFYPETWLKM